MSNTFDFSRTKYLDEFYGLESPFGSRKEAMSLELKGFRMQPGDANTPAQLERQGYVFFTRPHLNLSLRNCLRSRHMYQLLAAEGSVQAYIRNILDPGLFESPERLNSPLVDHENVFIPLLTNAIKSLSGWPDYALETYTSQEGQAKEVHSMVDSKMDYLREFDLDATFHNMAEEPISRLFYIWERYEAMVFEGILNPYPLFIANNTIDYNTRIYRIITDRTDRYVSKIAATGASFPISLPTGEFANYNSSEVFTSRKDITIRFKCNGALYFDDILKKEFNTAVMAFNRGIKEAALDGNIGSPDSNFLDISNFDRRSVFKGFTYPYIDLNTDRLMWLVDRANPRVIKTLDYLISTGEIGENDV